MYILRYTFTKVKKVCEESKRASRLGKYFFVIFVTGSEAAVQSGIMGPANPII
jgi:hypothetical protein